MILFDKDFSGKIINNSKFEQLQGYLDEQQAKATLAEFLYNNLGIAVEFFLGIKIFPYQEIILRGWFDHNFNMMVAGRGCAKSFCVSLFCCLYPIFFPRTKIVLASNAFRSTRRLILQIEKFLNSKKAEFARQCYTANKGDLEFTRRADEMVLEINEGHIVAVPLNEKIRGTRGDILVADEFLMIPEDTYKSVLVPFLTAKNNIQEQLEIKEIEDAMIGSGELTEEQRTILETDKKIIALSSASYDFEFCYKLYQEWVDTIKDQPKIGKKYFVSRLSYKAVPEELIEKDVIEIAKTGGEQTASFQREYMALFSSSSDGYFNIRKLHANTIKDGDFPHVQIKGEEDSKYILSIDPSFSSSKASDLFAMGIYLLNPSNRSITQVHTYGVAGAELRDHIQYLYYLISSFNIVLVIGDFGGANFDFIKTANESAYFRDRGVKLQFFEGDWDGEDYLNQIQISKNSYRQLDRKICYRQIFSSDWLRKSNEHLQAQIDYGKIYFASRITSHESITEKVLSEPVPVEIKDKNEKLMNMEDFIAYQEDGIEQTKRQLALIESKPTPLGALHFDLPNHLRRSKSPDRARKDCYTALLMACWGAKCYFDMMFTPVAKQSYGFNPVLVR